MTEQTPRLHLPLLAAGQAQKELVHNEALVLLDVLAQPMAETIGENAPPATPAAGQCWIVGPSPTGAWAGRSQTIAAWTEGGWRFAAPTTGMSAWVRAGGTVARHDGTAWRVAGAVAAPAGGATIDTQARAAIAGLIAALRGHGLISA